MSGWIATYTGRKFFPLAPREEDVDIEDIAHALSNVNRWTGHTNQPYSVAQHSVIVSNRCHYRDALWGLLHDASEAYLGDIARPVKRQPELIPYREAEERVMRCIARKFGLSWPEPEMVKYFDNKVLHTEARELMTPSAALDEWVDPSSILNIRIIPWSAPAAKARFLEEFRLLGGQCSHE